MVIGITGSRNYEPKQTIFDVLDKVKEHNSITKIVSGGAKGPDSWGAEWALENNIELKEHLPDWNKYGKSAGFRRNALIVEDSDVILAFWDGSSHGTKHSYLKYSKIYI
jgi:hypothetical protein